MKSIKSDENKGLKTGIIAVIIFALTFFALNSLSEASFSVSFFAASAALCVMSIIGNSLYALFGKKSMTESLSIKFLILIFSAVILLYGFLATIDPFHILIEGILLLIIGGMTTIITLDSVRD